MPAASARPDDDYHFDGRNTARQTRARYDFQDDCLAIRCIDNLVSGALRKVVVEWCSDYLAVSSRGEIELVSIKHREPDQSYWTPSELWKPVADLHRYWQATGRRCDCAFVSNLAVPANTVKELPATWSRRSSTPLAEAQDFVRDVLVVNGQVIPHRQHIRAVGVDRMRAALFSMDRDPQYATECYSVVRRRIASASTDEPASTDEKASRLAGLMRAMRDSAGPSLAEHTLTIADLRTLVLATHDDCVDHGAPRLSQVASASRPQPSGEWRPGDRVRLRDSVFVIHDPVTMWSLNGGDRRIEAPARQIEPVGRNVWLRGVITRDDSGGGRAELRREADVMRAMRTVSEAPRATGLIESGDSTVLLVERPEGRALTEAYGSPENGYPPLALDALLRGVRSLGAFLAALHDRGYAHRALSLTALVVRPGRGEIVPRDLGLAVLRPVAGEGPLDYRAPEQERPLLRPVGGWTDAFQLAAIVYHVATGNPPGRTPIPPSALRPTLASAVDDVLLPALRDDGAERPTVTALCGGLAGLVGRTQAAAI